MHHNNVEREAINREPAPSICVRLLKARQFLFGLSPNPLLRPLFKSFMFDLHLDHICATLSTSQLFVLHVPKFIYVRLCPPVHRSILCRPLVQICATSFALFLCSFSTPMCLFMSFFFQHHLATRLQHRFLTHYRSCCFLTKTRRLAIFFNQPNAYVIC